MSFIAYRSFTIQPSYATAAPVGTPPLGLNVDFNEQSLVDMIQNNQRFEQVGSTPLTEDSNGWPTSDFQWTEDNRYTFAWNSSATNIDPLKNATDLSGTYKLSFTGQAVLTAAGDDPAHQATTISNQSYSSSTNTTTADVTFGNPPGGLISVITFTQTKRNNTDSPGTGVTNVQLIRPGYATNTTQVFTTTWLHSINNYQWTALRFMDSLGTNNYAQPGSGEAYPYRLQWPTDRMQPNEGPLYGSNHKGVHGTIPWEDVILVAQLTHKDIWINIPVNASDDYVTQVANLLKNGNAATGNQGIPSDVHVYVEYSNEMWHYGFPQGPWNLQAAQDEVKAGGTNLNYDGKTDDDTIRFRRIAKRTIEIGKQFETVFSDNGSRIRPVINNASVNNDVDMLQYVSDNYGAPGSVLYGISQTGYYTSADSSSVSAILNGEKTASDNNASGYLLSRTIATYFGLHSLVYEGGQDEEGDTNLSNKFYAARDPGMQDVEAHDLLNNWYPNGGELYMQFAEVTHYSTYGMWGLSDDLNIQNSGKWNGMVQVMNASLPAVTAGLVPSSTVGQAVTIAETSGGTDYITPGTSPWKELLLRVSQSGTYSINIFGHQEQSGAVERVMLDNNKAGTLSMPLYPAADGYAPQDVTLSLSAGLHAVFIYVDGPGRGVFPSNGTIRLTTQNISGSSTPTPTPTPGGSLPSPWQNQDIGSVGLAGSATANNGSFTVNGSGNDIWDTADAFQYAYQPLNGDGTIVARIDSQQNTDGWAKAGVMIRESLSATSTHALMALTPGNGTVFQRRTSTGGGSSSTAGATATAPSWVKLQRAGSTFTGSLSSDGSNWTVVGSDTISMATNVYVGLAVTAHNNSVLNTTTFSQVSVTGSGSGTPSNLSQNKPTTASSIENSGVGPGYAVDGNQSTRWSSLYSDPQWLQVDLGATHQIREVKLFWETAYGKAYQIQVSNDGSTWTTISTQSNGSGGNEDLTGLTGSGRYVRIYATQRGTSWGYSLYEFQVFGV
ncbi:discoidin domain-containing protein [Tengunoibacter tsumagoiensis]|nr:discoidin domain-containing protein [Tengunoibacter tsumagoiensis]